MVRTLPGGIASGDRASTVYRGIDPARSILAAAQLKATIIHHAFDLQPRRFHSKRLHKENSVMHGASRHCGACHLNVAGSRKEDPALYYMVGDKGV